MEGDGTEGVVFPLSADGRRSTSALGRAVVADALRPVDPVGALGAEQETNWRSGYLIPFSPPRGSGTAVEGCRAVGCPRRAGFTARPDAGHGAGGTETGLDAMLSAPALASFATLSVPGAGQRETELSLPYHGERLRGDALARQLETWVSGGVIEPSCARSRQGGCGASGVAAATGPDSDRARGGRGGGPAGGAAALGRPGGGC